MRLAVVLAALLVAGAAHADTTADSLFSEGLALVKKGNYAEACPKFAESYKLEPATGALLNWAECEAVLGKTATAWALYRDVAVRAGNDRRGKEARLRAAELERGLCRLRIDAPAGVRVTRDGTEVDALGAAAPIDPGEHVIRAVREEEGAQPWSQTITVPRTDCGSTVVTVPSSWPGDRVVHAPVLPPPPPPAPEPPPRSQARRWSALGVAGAGVVALGVGAGFGIAALGKKSDADAQCFADGCTPEGSRLITEGQHRADLATGLVLGGAVALGVATVLWLTAPKH